MLSDRKDLPYVDAVIHEVLRIVSVIPLSAQHCATVDGAEIGGCQIPSKCQVIANLYAAMHNPKVFPEPDVFRPERFLGPDGQMVHHEAFLPFGMGICLLLCFMLISLRSGWIFWGSCTLSFKCLSNKLHAS